eukprot:154053-Rhodomonas_salina.1
MILRSALVLASTDSAYGATPGLGTGRLRRRRFGVERRGPSPVLRASVLRACYELPGTNEGYAAVLSGTDVGYAATRLEKLLAPGSGAGEEEGERGAGLPPFMAAPLLFMAAPLLFLAAVMLPFMAAVLLWCGDGVAGAEGSSAAVYGSRAAVYGSSATVYGGSAAFAGGM